MSFFGGPNIVTSGLTFYLDSANNKCYTGGTYCYELINQKIGTLSATTTYTTDNLGCFVFDGNSANIDLPSVSLPTNITISVWAKRTNTTNSFAPLVEQGTTKYFRFIKYNNYICFGNDNNVDNLYRTTSTFFSLNVWYNYVAVFDGSYKLYVNGIGQSIAQQTGSYGHWTTDKLRIGFRPYTAAVSAFYGYIPIVKIYNRPLSDLEILQNYNVLKSRFGL